MLLGRQETNMGLDMNCTYQISAYVDNVDLTSGDIREMVANGNVLLNSCKDFGLAVNIEENKYLKIRRQRAWSKI